MLSIGKKILHTIINQDLFEIQKETAKNRKHIASILKFQPWIKCKQKK